MCVYERREYMFFYNGESVYVLLDFAWLDYFGYLKLHLYI